MGVKSSALSKNDSRVFRSTDWTGRSQIPRITARTSTGSPRSSIKGKLGHSGRDTTLDYWKQSSCHNSTITYFWYLTSSVNPSIYDSAQNPSYSIQIWYILVNIALSILFLIIFHLIFVLTWASEWLWPAPPRCQIYPFTLFSLFLVYRLLVPIQIQL